MSSVIDPVPREEFERLRKEVARLASTVDSLQETLEVLQDRELMASIARADEYRKAGKVHGRDELLKRFPDLE